MFNAANFSLTRFFFSLIFQFVFMHYYKFIQLCSNLYFGCTFSNCLPHFLFVDVVLLLFFSTIFFMGTFAVHKYPVDIFYVAFFFPCFLFNVGTTAMGRLSLFLVFFIRNYLMSPICIFRSFLLYIIGRYLPKYAPSKFF